MRIQIRELAPEAETPRGTFPGKFGPDAFARQIGKEVPLKLEGAQYGMATLTAAEVAADGSSALLTLDLPDPEPSSPLWAFEEHSMSPMSFGFQARPGRLITDGEIVSWGPVLDPPWKA